MGIQCIHHGRWVGRHAEQPSTTLLKPPPQLWILRVHSGAAQNGVSWVCAETESGCRGSANTRCVYCLLSVRAQCKGSRDASIPPRSTCRMLAAQRSNLRLKHGVHRRLHLAQRQRLLSGKQCQLRDCTIIIAQHMKQQAARTSSRIWRSGSGVLRIDSSKSLVTAVNHLAYSLH